MEQHPIKINKVQIRNLQIEDYVQLESKYRIINLALTYPFDIFFWTREQIQKLIKIFPEGQIVTVVDDKIVGCALSIIVDYDKVKNDHTYAQVTGKETFNTHSSKGNILYGIEVFIQRFITTHLPLHQSHTNRSFGTDIFLCRWLIIDIIPLQQTSIMF